MRENKAERTFKRQQPLFFLHNGTVCVFICLRVAFSIFVFTFFILGKVAVVSLINIGIKFCFQNCIFRAVNQLLIAFFKHLGINTFTTVFQAIFFNFINKEQRQNLNTHIKIAQFFIKVCFNGLINLRTFQNVFINATDGFTQGDIFGISKFYTLKTFGAINTGDNITIINFAVTGFHK